MRLDIIAHQIHSTNISWFKIKKSNPKRVWMDKTQNKFAYRCLPATIMNQYGWDIICPAGFTAMWNGEPEYDSISIKYDDPIDNQYSFVASHFGNGVLTFNFDFIFRTSPNINILVKGPANLPKDAIQPLEGMIETDWLPFSFTMNWQFTRAFQEIRFEKDEPVATIIPIQRGFIEQFNTKIVPLDESPEFVALYKDWSEKRDNFNNGKFNNEEERKNGWQKFYFRGEDASGHKWVDNHNSNIKSQEFIEGHLNGDENLSPIAQCPIMGHKDFISSHIDGNENLMPFTSREEEGTPSPKLDQ